MHYKHKFNLFFSRKRKQTNVSSTKELQLQNKFDNKLGNYLSLLQKRFCRNEIDVKSAFKWLIEINATISLIKQVLEVVLQLTLHHLPYLG